MVSNGSREVPVLKKTRFENMSSSCCGGVIKRLEERQSSEQAVLSRRRMVQEMRRRSAKQKMCRMLNIVMNVILLTVGIFMTLIGLAINTGSRTKVLGRMLEVLRTETSIQAVRPFAVLCIFIGIAMVALASLGAISSCIKSKGLLVVYLTFIVIISVLEILTVFVLVIHRRAVFEFIGFNVRQIHRRAAEGWRYALRMLKELQRTFRCCGVNSPDDLTTKFNLTCSHPVEYKQGCVPSVIAFFGRNMSSLVAISSIFFIFQMIALCTAGGTILLDY